MTTTDDFFARSIDRYFESVRRGEHDPQCERRLRLHMCHCAKRRRIASGLTTPPTLIHHYPTCSNCGNEVWHDGDGFRCDPCATSWDGNAGEDVPGDFTDDYGDLNDERCKTQGPLLIGGDPR